MSAAEPAERKDLLEIAVEAARVGGALLFDGFDRPHRGVGTKSSPTDLVSDADRASEEAILGFIRARRPADGVLAEEGGKEPSETGLRWVVDPLDGTINYLYGLDQWAVSVAVQDRGRTVAGAVYRPVGGEMFAASLGLGATRDGEPIAVSPQTDLSQALIATGFAYDAELRGAQAAAVAVVLPSVRDIRRAGSAALDMCSAACGRVDAYYEAYTKLWDIAAGELIVTEAGGVVSELEAPIGDGSGVIAGNRVLHDALRALVVHQSH